MTKPKIMIPRISPIPMFYVSSLKALGAEPVLCRELRSADGYDGLLLPGGGDICPERYGEKNTACTGMNPALDELQLNALDAFARAGKPVFGICRGHQLINVYFGGTLIQHLEHANEHMRINGEESIHTVSAKEGSFLYVLYGREFTVNSTHHQGVGTPGEGLEVCAYAQGEVVEALSHSSLPVWSVQWHPERMCGENKKAPLSDGAAVLEFFLEKCRFSAEK